MSPEFISFLSRLLVATGLGLVIGFEREFRGRAGGLHTLGLVAAGSAIFAGIGAETHQAVTPYIVTGVGFLAGSVIFREGATVTGINSAATIWATAAVGALAGTGLYREALASATTIVLVNLLMDPLSKRLEMRIADRKANRLKEERPSPTDDRL